MLKVIDIFVTESYIITVGSAKCRLFLLKGREIESEVATAKTKYKFDYRLVPSKTGDGNIIIIEKHR